MSFRNYDVIGKTRQVTPACITRSDQSIRGNGNCYFNVQYENKTCHLVLTISIVVVTESFLDCAYRFKCLTQQTTKKQCHHHIFEFDPFQDLISTALKEPLRFMEVKKENLCWRHKKEVYNRFKYNHNREIIYVKYNFISLNKSLFYVTLHGKFQ
ncbi:hypothetical protein BDA99DRAFT_542201 [Phascolomyces articulosus]|uniref:Uncharacterized protein n=1 Tax=Phascolomyces articulosus TaxID=60185 RepID=A0AAD5P970_9FUNG|nr:hypothetical protein BDA99DRAFT_542201 [Phascolomyces articulosus]